MGHTSNKDAIKGLQPRPLWRYFLDISEIPRESGHEDAIRDYIASQARKTGLESRKDAAGNLLVIVPGSTGSLNRKPLALQSHMDMVCEKEPGYDHDFKKDPLKLVREDRWIKAFKTTLGADNGIGLAAMLTIMSSREIKHPPLELLFTVDEETGLTGASSLEKGFVRARTLINLDSEEEGSIYIGCAGGCNTEISLKLTKTKPPVGHVPVTVRLDGLKGGHSGIDIHEGRGNAIKLLARFLFNIMETIDLFLGDIKGGTKHNAIPRQASITIYIKPQELARLKEAIKQFNQVLLEELKDRDEHAQITIEDAKASGQEVFSREDTKTTCLMLYALPHGVIRMSKDLENATETSTNCAICTVDRARGVLKVLTSQRSILPTAIKDISDQVRSIGLMAGADARRDNEYPAWRPNMESEILNITKKVYNELFSRDPEVKVIHAGLECAVLAERYPGMDMVSFGPTIENAHSPSERVDIDSVARFYRYLVSILEHLV